MNGSDVIPKPGEPLVPRFVLWTILAAVIFVTILCVMAMVVFLLNPPPG